MHTRQKGNKGEDIACTFIQNKGFTILARNYFRKWGELDIIAYKDDGFHFFEVKSVTWINSSDHKPEDNVHGLKRQSISRMIETYLEEVGKGLDTEFQFHVLCVYLDLERKKARVKWIENIIL